MLHRIVLCAAAIYLVFPVNNIPTQRHNTPFSSSSRINLTSYASHNASMLSILRAALYIIIIISATTAFIMIVLARGVETSALPLTPARLPAISILVMVCHV